MLGHISLKRRIPKTDHVATDIDPGLPPEI